MPLVSVKTQKVKRKASPEPAEKTGDRQGEKRHKKSKKEKRDKRG